LRGFMAVWLLRICLVVWVRFDPMADDFWDFC
jgi:hypothetical protein